MGSLILFGRLAFLNAFFLKNGYALAAWARSGSPAARLIPAVLFLLAAAIPPAVCILKKNRPSPAMKLCCALLLLAGIAQATGLLDCAGLVARWFLYQGL
jgi:hypothetical protein